MNSFFGLFWALLSGLGTPCEATVYTVSSAQFVPSKFLLAHSPPGLVFSHKQVSRQYIVKVLYDETFGKYEKRQSILTDTLYDADISKLLIYKRFSISLPLFKGSMYQQLLARRLQGLLAAEFRRDIHHYKRFTLQQRALLMQQDSALEPAVDWSENIVSKAIFLITPLKDSLVGVSITRLYGGKNPPESYRNDDYLFRLVKGALRPIQTAHWGEQHAPALLAALRSWGELKCKDRNPTLWLPVLTPEGLQVDYVCPQAREAPKIVIPYKYIDPRVFHLH
jgi:hypothetical protein